MTDAITILETYIKNKDTQTIDSMFSSLSDDDKQSMLNTYYSKLLDRKFRSLCGVEKNLEDIIVKLEWEHNNDETRNKIVELFTDYFNDLNFYDFIIICSEVNNDFDNKDTTIVVDVAIQRTELETKKINRMTVIKTGTMDKLEQI